MFIFIRLLASADSAACDAINRSLPDWFGIEEGLAEALGYLQTHRGLVAEIDGNIAGYLTYDQPFAESAEISWMAVSPAHHRSGIGRALVQRLEEMLRAEGCELLSVKTLADLHPSPEYAQTRSFYHALGFKRLMVLPELWDPANPCLVMVKVLG